MYIINAIDTAKYTQNSTFHMYNYVYFIFIVLTDIVNIY